MTPLPDIENAHAYSPTGVLIIGTREVVYGTCGIVPGSFSRKDGEITVEYDGNGTELDWDGQESFQIDGKTVYLDENGHEWTEDQLSLIPEESDDE